MLEMNSLGNFGENFTTEGLDESECTWHELRVDGTWLWYRTADACYKLVSLGDILRFLAGRTGFYFSVLGKGDVGRR